MTPGQQSGKKLTTVQHKGTRTVQADSVSDADSESRHKECPLFISAGAYSGGRLSQTVCQNDFLILIGADFRNLNLPALYAYPNGL